MLFLRCGSLKDCKKSFIDAFQTIDFIILMNKPQAFVDRPEVVKISHKSEIKSYELTKF